MNSWVYRGELVEELPEGYVAFTYKIYIGENVYYGKKGFFRSIKRPPLAGKKRHRRDTVESNWKKYCSSSNIVKEFVEAGGFPRREILRLCKSVKEATYYENKLLYEHIEDENCVNDNISGKFFKKEIAIWMI